MPLRQSFPGFLHQHLPRLREIAHCPRQHFWEHLFPQQKGGLCDFGFVKKSVTIFTYGWFRKKSVHGSHFPNVLYHSWNTLEGFWVFKIFEKRRDSDFFHIKGGVSKIGGYFKKEVVSLSSVIFLWVFGVCVCVFVFCLSTPFLSALVFHRKNLVL